MSEQFIIKWHDSHREPQCAPDPAFPEGRNIDLRTNLNPRAPSCELDLPYPAKRCGLYMLTCRLCNLRVGVTTAGRVDDPRHLTLSCKEPECPSVSH